MDPRRFCSSVTPTVTDSELDDRGVRGPSMEPWKMTRRLPEGPWDPTKIPRIQILMSRVVFLVGTGGIPFPQVESQIGRTVSVRKIQLDKTDRSHNPKVGGSNPPPATQKDAGHGPIREDRPFCCPREVSSAES